MNDFGVIIVRVFLYMHTPNLQCTKSVFLSDLGVFVGSSYTTENPLLELIVIEYI
jgi:hypothetical protein